MFVKGDDGMLGGCATETKWRLIVTDTGFISGVSVEGREKERWGRGRVEGSTVCECVGGVGDVDCSGCSESVNRC